MSLAADDDSRLADDVTMAQAASEQAGLWTRLLNFGSRRRVPVILQTEAAECGLACVAMVAAYHGHTTDLLTLRARFPSSLRGLTLQDVMEIAGTLGLVSRPVQVELDKLGQLYRPCILHWNLKHFVVLTKVHGDSIEIVDPARGRRRMKLSEVSKHFTGIALELEPSPNLQRVERRAPVSLRSLAGAIHGLGRGLAQVFALALLLELLGLLAPQFMQMVVDQVLADADTNLLTFLGASFGLLLLLKIVVDALRSWTVMWLGANLGIAWTGNVFNHLLKLPLDYFSKRFLGDVMSRFGSIATIQQTLTTQFVVVLIDGLMASVTAIMLFVYSPKLAAVTIGFALLYALLRVLYFKAYQDASQSQINLAAHQQGALIETLRGMQTIRLNNRMAQRSARFMNSTAAVTNASIVMQRLNLVFDALNNTTTGAQRIVVLWLGAWLAVGGDLTPGMLMAFVAYSDQFTTRFVALADYAVQFRLLRLHGERLADIVLTAPEKNADGNYVGEVPHHGIAFRDISYQYNFNTRFVLRGCSFELADGEVVAITGPSGSGKSTVAKVLLGVLDPQEGTVHVGGVDVQALGKHRARTLIGSVLQDDQLFSGSILENITFFDATGTLERAQRAAALANLAAEIEAMPMGYHTPIGDMGSSLSGGQQQRLLLARAFYREPRILVLDEATSHLDLDNETRICDAVRRAGITTLIIAHRPQTIQSADRVLVLRHGKLVEPARAAPAPLPAASA
jgi:ATP-binding cassette subfamily B protein RaxB